MRLLERRGREELPSLAGDMVLLNRLVILWQLLQKKSTAGWITHITIGLFLSLHT